MSPDRKKLISSPLSSPGEKKEALKVLQAKGVQISPAALAKLGLA